MASILCAPVVLLLHHSITAEQWAPLCPRQPSSLLSRATSVGLLLVCWRGQSLVANMDKYLQGVFALASDSSPEVRKLVRIRTHTHLSRPFC